MRTALALFLLLAAGVHAAPADWKPQVDALVKPLIDGGWCRSMVVGLVNGPDRVVLAYGSTNATTPTTPNADTIYEIGSVSKTFTSLALASLAGEQMVSLDDPLQKHIPSAIALPTTTPPIRLVDLATHTSGLPRVAPGLPTDTMVDPGAGMTPGMLFAKLKGIQLASTPGQKYEYSNFGAALLGQALARRARRSYEQLVTERLFHPLGLDSSFVKLPDEFANRLAMPAGDDMADFKPWADSALAPAGWIKSSMNDMLVYLKAQMDPPDSPLGRAITASHVPRIVADAGQKLEVALGWHVVDRKVWYHNGETGGSMSYVAFLKDLPAGVVVLSTGNTYAVDLVHEQLLVVAAGAKPTPLSLPAEVPTTSGALDVLAGRYRASPDVLITVTRAGTRLKLQVSGQVPMTLYAEAVDRFRARLRDIAVAFRRDAAGHVAGLTVSVDGHEESATLEP